MNCNHCGQELGANNKKIVVGTDEYCEFCDQYAVLLRSRAEKAEAKVEQLTKRITDLIIEKNGMAEQVCNQLADLSRLRALCNKQTDALAKIAAWEFDIMGDCVKEAMRVASEALPDSAKLIEG